MALTGGMWSGERLGEISVTAADVLAELPNAFLRHAAGR